MIAVIGCGNPNRRDDGVGPQVIRLLQARGVGSDVRLLDVGTDGMAAMFAARGSSALVIVDACRSGSEPGAVFEVPGDDLERAYEPALNLHDFRWDHALHAGRKIFRDAFPTDVAVFLIEAESIDLGLGLTPAVARGATIVADRIAARIAAARDAGARADLPVKRGSVYVARATYDRFFPGLETVILLRRGDDLLILPARSAVAGGFLLKLRNSAGDRVVHAAEFFRDNGIGDDRELHADVAWSEAQGGLEGLGFFALQT